MVEKLPAEDAAESESAGPVTFKSLSRDQGPERDRLIADYNRLAQEAVRHEDERLSLPSFETSDLVILTYQGDEPIGVGILGPGVCNEVEEWGIYIKDIFVSSHARKQGVGEAVLRELIRLGRERFPSARIAWGRARRPSRGILARLGFQVVGRPAPPDDPAMVQAMVLRLTDNPATSPEPTLSEASS